jgi:tRNA pseudouridine13 synthase
MNDEALRVAIDPETLPRRLPDRPRVFARIKAVPEDFVVDEAPAYEPSGEGSHLYLRVEKRDCAGGEMLRRLAEALGIGQNEVGYAGTKDRRAVTRQWVSVPEACLALVEAGLALDRIRVLAVTRHGNKLRTGHLRGNVFAIVLRGADPALSADLAATASRIADAGFFNLYGPQRFGRGGETVSLGCRLLAGRDTEAGGGRFRVGPFERRMAISAVQAALFNAYVVRRVAAGQVDRVLPGDVMQKVATGGLFRASDIAAEQARLDAGETRVTGPIFGHKLMEAEAEAGALEASVLADAGLDPSSFRPFAKLAEGTRRALLVRPEGLSVAPHDAGVELRFFLPRGSYASVLLREFVDGPEVASADM